MKPRGKDILQFLRMTPSSGFSNPAIMLISVVLPVPFGAKNSNGTAHIDTKRRLIQNDLALRTCPKGLTHVSKLNHRGCL